MADIVYPGWPVIPSALLGLAISVDGPDRNSNPNPNPNSNYNPNPNIDIEWIYFLIYTQITPIIYLYAKQFMQLNHTFWLRDFLLTEILFLGEVFFTIWDFFSPAKFLLPGTFYPHTYKKASATIS